VNIYIEKKVNIKSSIILFCFNTLCFCLYPTKYNINHDELNNNFRLRDLSEDLNSSSIVDLRILNNQSIAIATSGGLGLLDNSMNLYSFEDSNLPVGGNPALEVYTEEQLIIVSGVETVNFLNEEVSSGTGIAWSTDNGSSWKFIPQPQDQLPECENLTCDNPLNSPDECECSPAGSGCSWDVPSQTCSQISNNIVINWGGQTLSSLAIQTTAKNVTYDVSADTVNKYIYTANWAGMLRRFKYTDENPNWEIIPLPMDNQSFVNCGSYPASYVYNPVDPQISGNLNYGGNHNHKVFSVYTEFYNDQMYVWAGTADGVNRGIIDDNGCIDWIHYTTFDGLGGNWIIDIVPQYLNNSEFPRIWLVSWDREESTPHPNAITYTDDNGESWFTIDQFGEEYIDSNGNDIYDLEDIIIDDLNNNNYYDGATPYSFYFTNDVLYASTNRGVFFAFSDNILNWNKLEFPAEILNILDYNQNIENQIFSEEKVYTCIKRNNIFFIGTPKGLVWVQSQDNIDNPNLWNLESWEYYIGSNQEIVNENKLHIWPNPFFIENIYTNVDFQYKTDYNYGIMNIYDFSMNLVDSFECTQFNNYNNLECSWDGRNKNNIKVSNGVYFCKLQIGKQEVWEKLMVINAVKGHY
tara:strand:- start:847 stop:2754 length:1908 start_codon:yes stop_codon:yes gene_type:complete